jgi:hypothetical protein
VELCTIAAVTYVSLPDDIVLSLEQPFEIKGSIQRVELTDDLRNLICEHSPHVWLISQRVRDRIESVYSISNEIKLLRTAPSADFDEYNSYVESCRAWGRAQKAKLGL